MLGSFLEGRWLVMSFTATFLPEKPFLPLTTPAHAHRHSEEWLILFLCPLARGMQMYDEDAQGAVPQVCVLSV